MSEQHVSEVGDEVVRRRSHSQSQPPEHLLQLTDDARWLLDGLRSSADRATWLLAVSRRTAERLEATGKGLDLSRAPLSGLDLSTIDLRGANLSRAQLHSTRLDAADLRRATLICPGLERASFRGANLRGAYTHAIAAQVTDFSEADLRDLVDATGGLFHGCKFVGSQLAGSTLSGCTFYQCTLDEADVQGAQLQDCFFIESRCHAANFAGSSVDRVSFHRSELTRTSLAGVKGAGVSVVNPISASDMVLDTAHLPQSRFMNVHSPGLSARGLSAPRSSWQGVVACGADFRGADFSTSQWVECNLADADLSNSLMDNSTWFWVVSDRVRLVQASVENWSVGGGERERRKDGWDERQVPACPKC